MKLSRSYLYLIAVVFVLFVGILLGLGLNYSQTHKVLLAIHNIETSVNQLTKHAHHLSTMHIPILNNLKIVSLRHQDIKVRDYDIKLNDAFDTMMSIGGSNTNLRFPTYIYDGAQVPFHPYQWSVNLLSLSRFVRLGSGSYHDIEAKVSQLFEQLQQHIIVQDQAMFIRYPFMHSSCGSIRQADWVSGLGQGYVLAALVALSRAHPDIEVKKQAAKIFESFLVLKRPSHDGLWVSFIDDAQYLWFEEYPSAAASQPRVLNGHIGALMGIYAYYRLWPNDEAKLLLQAGITTLNRYFEDFRRPGAVNRYCLADRESVDYGPKRAILQQRWLHDITGDDFFGQAASALMTDMAFK